ncbi:hypothetical protein TNCV_742771 [Trichonephila clavipes]|nr:hypothetical protein TNCV_742771 [Trichonephila clavipes]
MAPHRPRKSAPTEYATDEEDMRPLSGRSYSGQSGYSKNRDQKVREKISGGGNMGCGTKESDFIGRARSSDNGE